MGFAKEDGYRAFVGIASNYSLRGAASFDLLVRLGLREGHRLLDIGCGSLSAGKLLIPYMYPARYCGVEPEEWLIEDGLAGELGADIVFVKQPRFCHSREFCLDCFGTQFHYMLACSIFTHTTLAQAGRLMEAAAGVLAPTGLFIATCVLAGKDDDPAGWVYPGYAKYTGATLRRLGAQNGLDVEFKGNWPAPYQQTWMAITWDGRKVEPAPFITL